jgi:hypothetical protein
MCASWNDKYNPDLIASRLEQIKTIDKETGRASFNVSDYYDYFAVLCSIAKFLGDIPETERPGILNQAIFSAGTKGVITAKSLLKEISIFENNFLNEREKSYVLATSLSLRTFDQIPNYRVNKALITFMPSLPPAFQKNREFLKSTSAKYVIEKLPSYFLAVRVHIKARSIYEAADKSFQSLDLIRGIWNLGLNRLTYLSLSFGSKPKPINKIVLGPFHTLHEPGGKLSTEGFWYDPHFNYSMELYKCDKKEDYNYLLSFAKWTRNKLKLCLYNNEISEAILRYVRALDYSDYDVAFLKLWSVLEMLTNTIKESYDKTIKRTIFLYRDHEFHYQVLNHLRDYRNKSVHGSSGDEEVKTYIYQLKGYIEELLIFHLTNKMKFATLAAAAEFLDLSPNLDFLIIRYKLYQRGIKFITHTDKG